MEVISYQDKVALNVKWSVILDQDLVSLFCGADQIKIIDVEVSISSMVSVKL